MPIVVGVKFRGAGKVYYFGPGDVQDLAVQDHVIVETARGIEMGQVTMAPKDVVADKVVSPLKPVMRKASTADLLNAERFRAKEDAALVACREYAAKAKLEMKVVSAEYNYDGSRLTFAFTSEERVDFRELVRELAHRFKTRIELRQIGVRDEAKIVGGVGKCGRPLCCATWLSDFAPVSIRMAKQQDLPLSPMEISGLCGRLLCCLAYETDYYKEVKAKFPKVGKTIETAAGPARIIRIRVFDETATAVLQDGTVLELTADQIAGVEPITIECSNGGLNDLQQNALRQAIDDEAEDELGDDDEPQAPPPPPSRRRPESANAGVAQSDRRRPDRQESTRGPRPPQPSRPKPQPTRTPPSPAEQPRTDEGTEAPGSSEDRRSAGRSGSRRRRRSSRGGHRSPTPAQGTPNSDE